MAKIKNNVWVLNYAQPVMQGFGEKDPNKRLEYLKKLNIKQELDIDDFYSYYKFMGIALMQLEKYGEALESLEKALDHSKNDPQVKPNGIAQILIWKGKILEKLNKKTEALLDYEKVDKIMPNRIPIEKASLLIKMGKKVEAKNLLKKIISKLDDSETESYYYQKCKKLLDEIKDMD